MIKTPHKKIRLSNGLTLLYLYTKDDPISAAHLFLPGGASDELESKGGLTTLLWSLFMKGTDKRSARQLAEDLESLGAYAGGGANQDYVSLSCYSIAENFIPTFDIFQEALFQPNFRNTEVDREKTALTASIQAKQESLFTVTHEQTNQKLYGGHPYARPISGTASSVSRIRTDQLYKWHAKTVLPNQAVLSLATSHKLENLYPVIEKYLGPNDWHMGDVSWRNWTPNPFYPKASSETLTETKFEQAFLMKAYPACSTSSKEYTTLKVMNALLGGGMSARLFQSLREKQGLAYDVGSFFPTRKSGSGFYIYLGLQKDNIEKARTQIDQEIERLKNEQVPDQTLNEIKNYLKGSNILDHQTNSQRAHYLGWWEILGLTSDFDFQYNEEIEKVTAQAIQTTAQKMFSQPAVWVQSLPRQKKESVAQA